jgi:HEAT repeat protein
VVVHDAAWPVRARAAEEARGVANAADLQAALVAAVRDPEPRVREAALAGLVDAPPPDGVRAAGEVLAHDGWSFVKIQAVGVLMNASSSSAVDDALGHALGDPGTRVRTAAVLALARRRAGSWRDSIRERLDDRSEDGEVRATAASALGALCDGSAVGRLTELARVLSVPGIDDDAQQVGFGALVGLAALKPKDLHDRLGPLLAPGAPPEVRAAATRALTARGMCTW